MTCGRIKCFFVSQEYGYIEDNDGREVYFHLASVEGGGSFVIVNGATVYFEAITTRMGLEASRVTFSGSLAA